MNQATKPSKMPVDTHIDRSSSHGLCRRSEMADGRWQMGFPISALLTPISYAGGHCVTFPTAAAWGVVVALGAIWYDAYGLKDGLPEQADCYNDLPIHKEETSCRDMLLSVTFPLSEVRNAKRCAMRRTNPMP